MIDLVGKGPSCGVWIAFISKRNFAFWVVRPLATTSSFFNPILAKLFCFMLLF